MLTVKDGTLENILSIHNAILEMNRHQDIEQLQTRLANKRFISLVAELDNQLVGYKLGFWLDNHNFYSWMGGVLPQFRKINVAQSLLNEQERRVINSGGTNIQVKSMNRFKGMLIFLLKNDYQIVGYEAQKGKILFEKPLLNP
ncbi:MAG: GNAT family N-acetyltransferase [Alteromonadaceae bacterium]|nr:GNAT family N-acetyltransferase [Alteromonadaceae bacterium]